MHRCAHILDRDIHLHFVEVMVCPGPINLLAMPDLYVLLARVVSHAHKPLPVCCIAQHAALHAGTVTRQGLDVRRDPVP